MSFTSKHPEELVLNHMTTLEDIQESGYSLNSHCKSCNEFKSLNLELFIKELGRAFPICLIHKKVKSSDILGCSPDVNICLRNENTNKITTG